MSYIAVLLMLVVGTSPADAQVRGRVEGMVIDARTHEPIPRATVHVSLDGISNVGTKVDQKGRFRLGLPAGRRELLVRAPGYRACREPVQVEAAGLVVVEIELMPQRQ